VGDEVSRGDLFYRSSPISERLFDALCTHPYGLTSKELVEKMYFDREDGGPLTAAESISVRVCYINKRFERLGISLRIRGHGGPGSRYQIYVVK